MEGESSSTSTATTSHNRYVDVHSTAMTSMEHDQLVGMLAQEEASYTCPDYLSPDYRVQRKGSALEQSIATSLSVVEECANLVTDLSLAISHDEGDRSSSKQTAYSQMQSPVDVTTPPNPLLRSPRSSTAHLHALYMNETKCLGEWRERMVDWAYMAADTFGLERSIIGVAFDLLDRFLAKEVLLECQGNDVMLTREDFQLYSMTCLYMAVKILESTKRLSLLAMVDMSRGYFTVADFEETELEILNTLEWKLNAPTALRFVQQYLAVSEALGELVDMAPGVLEREALVQCEQVVSDPYFISKRKSTVAAAVILCSARKQFPLHHCDNRLRKFCNSTLKPLGVNTKSFEFRQIYKHLQQLSC